MVADRTLRFAGWIATLTLLKTAASRLNFVDSFNNLFTHLRYLFLRNFEVAHGVGAADSRARGKNPLGPRNTMFYQWPATLGPLPAAASKATVRGLFCGFGLSPTWRHGEVCVC